MIHKGIKTFIPFNSNKKETKSQKICAITHIKTDTTNLLFTKYWGIVAINANAQSKYCTVQTGLNPIKHTIIEVQLNSILF